METLDKILNAGIELFRQYGFKSVTMDELARRAGISKKTLYQHFANKNDIVREAVVQYKNKISDNCNAIMEESENSIEAMVRVMGMFDNINRQINPIAMMELERFYPQVFKEFRDKMKERDVDNIAENIRKGIKEGLYRSEINPEFMSRYRMEMSYLMYHSTLLVKEEYNLQLVGREVSEHFLYGIMTHKGEKLYQKYKEQYFKQVAKL